jgi:hypothetical protein
MSKVFSRANTNSSILFRGASAAGLSYGEAAKIAAGKTRNTPSQQSWLAAIKLLARAFIQQSRRQVKPDSFKKNDTIFVIQMTKYVHNIIKPGL